MPVTVPPEADEDAFYVLLENDALITKVSVPTDRLLLPPVGEEHINDVQLVIGVGVNVIAVTYAPLEQCDVRTFLEKFTSILGLPYVFAVVVKRFLPRPIHP